MMGKHLCSESGPEDPYEDPRVEDEPFQKKGYGYLLHQGGQLELLESHPRS